jgi:hypothetical protein
MPRIILQELHNNLSGKMLNKLYKLLIKANIEIVDLKAPIKLVQEFKVVLPFEDSVIAAYCKLFEVDYLVSENRHFLVSFRPKMFRVLPADKFLRLVYKIRQT